MNSRIFEERAGIAQQTYRKELKTAAIFLGKSYRNVALSSQVSRMLVAVICR